MISHDLANCLWLRRFGALAGLAGLAVDMPPLVRGTPGGSDQVAQQGLHKKAGLREWHQVQRWDMNEKARDQGTSTALSLLLANEEQAAVVDFVAKEAPCISAPEFVWVVCVSKPQHPNRR